MPAGPSCASAPWPGASGGAGGQRCWVPASATHRGRWPKPCASAPGSPSVPRHCSPPTMAGGQCAERLAWCLATGGLGKGQQPGATHSPPALRDTHVPCSRLVGWAPLEGSKPQMGPPTSTSCPSLWPSNAQPLCASSWSLPRESLPLPRHLQRACPDRVRLPHSFLPPASACLSALCIGAWLGPPHMARREPW